MTEKQIETKSYKTVYVAADGIEFDTRDECSNYDKSAFGVLMGRVKAMSVNDTSEEDIFCCGSPENRVLACIPRSKEDINTLRQTMIAAGQNEKYASNLTDDNINKPVLLTIGYAGDGAWFDTLDTIVQRALGSNYKNAHVEFEKNEEE